MISSFAICIGTLCVLIERHIPDYTWIKFYIFPFDFNYFRRYQCSVLLWELQIKFDWQFSQQSRMLHAPNAHTHTNCTFSSSTLQSLWLLLLILFCFRSALTRNQYFFSYYDVSTTISIFTDSNDMALYSIRRHWIAFFSGYFTISLLCALCQQMCYILSNNRLPSLLFYYFIFGIVHSYHHRFCSFGRNSCIFSVINYFFFILLYFHFLSFRSFWRSFVHYRLYVLLFHCHNRSILM